MCVHEEQYESRRKEGETKVAWCSEGDRIEGRVARPKGDIGHDKVQKQEETLDIVAVTTKRQNLSFFQKRF